MSRAAENWMLCVYPAVPPGQPLCRAPSSVTTGRNALLSCHDSVGSPPPKYLWYKDGIPLPLEPNKISGFKNATYRINQENGNLVSYNSLLCTIFTVTVVAFKIKNVPRLAPSGVSLSNQDGLRAVLLCRFQ